jgi:hypothetical protein
VKNYLRLLLIVSIAAIFALSVLTESQAQRRSPPFSHSTPAHRQGKYKDCSACHIVPTANWKSPRQDKQEPFPDVVSFPYEKHTTCNGCHSTGAKPDIFSNRGAFCGNCHVSASVRATGGRGVLPFPVRSNPRQFATRFPHNIHQDVMASINKYREDTTALLMVSFSARRYEPRQVDSCAVCHKTRTELPKFSALTPTDMKPLADAVPDTGTPNFPPIAGYFKDNPRSHASCFACHYQAAKPLAADCAGCHVPTTPYARSSIVKRYSLKFDHQQKDHARTDCKSCHIGIAQNADLKTLMGADVPIIACTSCHTPHAQDLADELGQREQSVADKKPPFQCTYCHTSAIGRFPPPPSHVIR